MYTFTHTSMYIYTGLEIGGVVLQNANHFWGNCESLWQSDSPNFFGTANHFWSIVNHFLNGFARRPILNKISPFLY